MASRCKASVCDRSLAEIAGSNVSLTLARAVCCQVEVSVSG